LPIKNRCFKKNFFEISQKRIIQQPILIKTSVNILNLSVIKTKIKIAFFEINATSEKN